MNPRVSLDCSSPDGEVLEKASPAVAGRTKFSPYWELTKPRLSFLSVITALIGYTLSTGHWDWVLLVWLFLGTSLAAGSAAALNQWLERERDTLMARTQSRPLPQGHLRPLQAAGFGVVTGVVGCLILAWGINPVAGLMAVATILLYVLVYTPLKTHSVWNTEVGAVAGALPPLIGVAAAEAMTSWQGWFLFAVLFAWQMPHFLAISWIYREDYARGGYPMRVTRKDSEKTVGNLMILYTLGLILVTLLPFLLGELSLIYAVGAVVAGLALLWPSWRFRTQPAPVFAWRLFFTSLIYLPAVLGLAVVDYWFI